MRQSISARVSPGEETRRFRADLAELVQSVESRCRSFLDSLGDPSLRRDAVDQWSLLASRCRLMAGAEVTRTVRAIGEILQLSSVDLLLGQSQLRGETELLFDSLRARTVDSAATAAAPRA